MTAAEHRARAGEALGMAEQCVKRHQYDRAAAWAALATAHFQAAAAVMFG